MIFEIVILAMVAAFLGLRLYSVLGRRAEHEEEIVPQRFERPDDAQADAERGAGAAKKPAVALVQNNLPAFVEDGVRAIAAADSRFDLLPFLEGAKGAYGLILGAFWEGDKDTLRELCDDDVYESFAGAIDARVEAGEQLDNTLIRIEDATVKFAELDGRVARISVLFVSDIAAVTRDKDDVVIAGSLDDAVESRDVWTFMRNVDSAGPNWTLDETDQD